MLPVLHQRGKLQDTRRADRARIAQKAAMAELSNAAVQPRAERRLWRAEAPAKHPNERLARAIWRPRQVGTSAGMQGAVAVA
jgi:hypothetical protein